MSKIAEIKLKARRGVHDAFAFSAEYTSPAGVAISCNVKRNMGNVGANGDLGGLSGIGNAGFASNLERQSTAVFLVEEVPDVQRGGILEFEDGLRFRIATVHPPYGISITAEIEHLS